MATGGQSSPELAKFKAEQKSVRTKITTAEKAARGVMAQNGSRHSLREIVARIKVLGTQAERHQQKHRAPDHRSGESEQPVPQLP